MNLGKLVTQNTLEVFEKLSKLECALCSRMSHFIFLWGYASVLLKVFAECELLRKTKFMRNLFYCCVVLPQ